MHFTLFYWAHGKTDGLRVSLEGFLGCRQGPGSVGKASFSIFQKISRSTICKR
uniref:Uncharacterized protein n=1 Tax=Parascaris equorum TaxID=6256 RepID=A0A914R8D1_PAREQ